MSLSLHTIKSNKGATKKRKRIGRGNAAGQGTYCGKGLKGQKCRSGVSGLKRRGMRQILLKTPKERGFKSLASKKEVVSMDLINKHFKDGETIEPNILFEKKIISTKKHGVKILATGDLKIKKMKGKIKMEKTKKERVNKKQ